MSLILSCPHCRNPLQLGASVPSGIDILCPRCKKLFKVPAPNVPVAASASAAHAKSAASPVAAPARNQAVQTKQAPTWPSAPVPDRQAATAGRFAIAVLAGLALAAVTVVVAGWLFLRESPAVT